MNLKSREGMTHIDMSQTTHIDMSQTARSYFRARRYDPLPTTRAMAIWRKGPDESRIQYH